MLILLPCLPIGVIGVEVSVDIMGLGRDWGEVDGARGRNSSTSVEEKSMGCCRTLGGGGGQAKDVVHLGDPMPLSPGECIQRAWLPGLLWQDHNAQLLMWSQAYDGEWTWWF